MIVNKSVYLKIPTVEELKHTEILLSDVLTMSFNEKWGGTISFPKEKWQSFYNEYNNSNNRFYFHIYNLDNIFVGEISSRYHRNFKTQILNIKVLYKFRGNNHAYEALEAFLDHLFIDMDIVRISDNVAHTSVSGIRLLKSFGFIETYKTDDYVMLQLDRKDYL